MKFVKIIFSTFLSIALLAGCSAKPEMKNPNDLNVVASFAPVYAITLALTDGTENISVSCMAANSTGCLHDYQITADDMKAVDTADLYIIGGAGMEGSFLDKIMSAYPQLAIADSSKGISLIFESEEEYNSHIWLSTKNASVMAQNIASSLAGVSPENKQVIEANLKKFTERMEQLYTAYKPSFDTLSHRKIVTFHEAFEYLAEEFGLDVAAVIEVEPGTAPDPQTLNELIQTVKTDAVSAVFTEPQYPDDTAQVLSRETGVAVYSLDPIVTGEMHKDSFINTFENDLKILVNALS